MATCDTGVTSAVAQLWSPEASFRYATRITLPRCLYTSRQSEPETGNVRFCDERACCLLHV